MQIVIDMDDHEYTEIKEDAEKFRSKNMIVPSLYKVIESGISLPEGHGRLLILDEKLVRKYFTSFSFSCQKWISEVGISNAALKVIEADKEVEK